MSKTYYHSTSQHNFYSILSDEKINPSPEGIVYCCTTPEDWLKFAAVRALSNDDPYVVLKIDVPDEAEVEETFDHSEVFFKCRCFGIVGEVPLDWVDLDNSYMYSQYRRKTDD